MIKGPELKANWKLKEKHGHVQETLPPGSCRARVVTEIRDADTREG